jgi:hypothetical protein
MNQTYIKLAIALVLFTTWVLLVVFNVPHADELINYIKIGLGALGAHTLTMVNSTPASSQPTTEVTQ